MMERAPPREPRRLRAVFLLPIPREPYRKAFVPGHGPDPGELWRLLSEQGIDVDIVDPNPWPLNPLAGRHPLYQSLDPWRSLKILLCSRHYDLVITANEGAAILLILLRRLFRFRPPVLVWDISPATTWRLRSWLQDYVLPRVDGIIVIGSNQVPYIAERWGAEIPVSVVGHDIDTEFSKPDNTGPAEYVLSVGDDVGRDYPTLMLATEGVAVDLVIKTRQALPVDPTKHQSVRLLPDRMDHIAFRALYAKCHFVVLPLIPDALNASGINALLEAFAMGKAVIVSESTGIRDFLLPDENCIMVPAYDVGAMRAAIERLLREPETRDRLGRNARRYVEENCSLPVFARRFAAALRDWYPRGNDSVGFSVSNAATAMLHPTSSRSHPVSTGIAAARRLGGDPEACGSGAPPCAVQQDP